jgi:hypothetical protein
MLSKRFSAVLTASVLCLLLATSVMAAQRMVTLENFTNYT